MNTEHSEVFTDSENHNNESKSKTSIFDTLAKGFNDMVQGVTSALPSNDSVNTDGIANQAGRPNLTVSDEQVINAANNLEPISTPAVTQPTPTPTVAQQGGDMDENSDYYKMKYYKYKGLYLNACNK